MLNFDFSYQFILKGVLTACVGFFSYFTIKIYFLRQKYKHIPGPPTNGIIGFYLGNIQDVIANKKKNLDLTELFTEWVQKYGKTIKFQILDQVIVHTADLAATRIILTEENFPKNPDVYKILGYPYNIRTVGQGLLTDMNETRWKHRRAMFNPAFHKQVLSGFMDEYNTKGDTLLEKLRLMADGKTVITLLDEFNRTTLDVIATVILL